MHPFNTGDVLDAVAYLKAYVLGDRDGLATLAVNGNPAAMLSALTAITAGMLTRTDADIPVLAVYIDAIATRLLERVTPTEDQS